MAARGIFAAMRPTICGWRPACLRIGPTRRHLIAMAGRPQRQAKEIDKQFEDAATQEREDKQQDAAPNSESRRGSMKENFTKN